MNSLLDDLKIEFVGLIRPMRGLAILPVFCRQRRAAGVDLLDEAIAGGRAAVRELEGNARIDTITVDNSSLKPLISFGGSIFHDGLLQDRVVNITSIIRGGELVRLPVSCVERGRWENSDRGFSESAIAPPALRAAILESVHESFHQSGSLTSDQSRVWATVSAYLCSTDTKSSTECLTDTFSSAFKNYSHEDQSTMTLPKKASGYVMATGRALVFELFDSPRTFHAAWDWLIAGVVLDSEQDCDDEIDVTSRDAVLMIKEAVNAIQTSYTAFGKVGRGIILSGRDSIGSAMIYGDSIVHLFFYMKAA